MKTQLDPFAFSIPEKIQIGIRFFAAILGAIAALSGQPIGVLGMLALEGGARGSLVGEVADHYYRWKKERAEAKKDSGSGPGTGPAAMAVLALAFLVSSCGTGVTKQFVIDSQQAVLATASQYFVGCSMVTVAPAFSVDWNQNLTYGGGMFAGCTDSSNLVEFRCQGNLDQTGKTSIQCEPLKLWTPAPEVVQ